MDRVVSRRHGRRDEAGGGRERAGSPRDRVRHGVDEHRSRRRLSPPGRRSRQSHSPSSRLPSLSRRRGSRGGAATSPESPRQRRGSDSDQARGVVASSVSPSNNLTRRVVLLQPSTSDAREHRGRTVVSADSHAASYHMYADSEGGGSDRHYGHHDQHESDHHDNGQHERVPVKQRLGLASVSASPSTTRVLARTRKVAETSGKRPSVFDRVGPGARAPPAPEEPPAERHDASVADREDDVVADAATLPSPLPAQLWLCVACGAITRPGLTMCDDCAQGSISDAPAGHDDAGREEEQEEAARKGKEKNDRKKQEKERKEKERLEMERKEKERKEKERKEKERKEKERKEKERKEKERKEKQRKEKERKEKERKKERKMEEEQLETERKEKQRVETERKEKERLEKEAKERKDRDDELARSRKRERSRSRSPSHRARRRSSSRDRYRRSPSRDFRRRRSPSRDWHRHSPSRDRRRRSPSRERHHASPSRDHYRRSSSRDRHRYRRSQSRDCDAYHRRHGYMEDRARDRRLDSDSISASSMDAVAPMRSPSLEVFKIPLSATYYMVRSVLEARGPVVKLFHNAAAGTATVQYTSVPIAARVLEDARKAPIVLGGRTLHLAPSRVSPPPRLTAVSAPTAAAAASDVARRALQAASWTPNAPQPEAVTGVQALLTPQPRPPPDPSVAHQQQQQLQQQQLAGVPPQFAPVAIPGLMPVLNDGDVPPGYSWDASRNVYACPPYAFDPVTRFYWHTPRRLCFWWEPQQSRFYTYANQVAALQAPDSLLQPPRPANEPELPETTTRADEVPPPRPDATLPGEVDSSQHEVGSKRPRDAEQGDVQRAKQARTSTDAAVASETGSGDAETQETTVAMNERMGYLDYEQNICRLCMRGLRNRELLQRHVRESKLHRENLALAKQQRDRQADRRPDPASRGNGASNEDTGVSSASLRAQVPAAQPATAAAAATPAAASQVVDLTGGIGARMMKAMGWNEGSGLGRDGQGRAEPLQLASQRGTTGLGAGAGSNNAVVDVLPSDSRGVANRKRAMQRYQQAIDQ